MEPKEKKQPPAFKYKEQHAVIIKVATEEEQKQLFERLTKEGYNNLKVVSV